MAFTKVVGAGIHTQSNIDSHNINSTGIITATKFDGPFDNIVIGGGGLDISGIVTATELDINGNGDISGNLVVGGNLTANGDFTTLNTTLREVELLRVDANDANLTAGIITQRNTGDILNLSNGSTELFTVVSDGNTGIGTNNPKVKLEVVGSGVSFFTNDKSKYIDLTAGKIELVRDDSLAYIDFRTSNAEDYDCRIQQIDNGLRFVTGGNGNADERLRIDSSGQIKIADGGFLSVNTNPGSTYGLSEALRIDDGGSTHDRALQIFEYHHSGTRYHRIQFNTNTSTDGSAYTYTQGNYGGSSSIGFGNAGDLSFFTDTQVSGGSTSSITPSERLRITGIGSVGINQSNPEDLLHIKSGKIRIENAIVSNNDSTISYDNTDFLIDVDPNNVRGSSKFQVDVDDYTGLVVDDQRNVYAPSGNVGIGTNTPKLSLHIHQNNSNASFAHFTNTTTGDDANQGVSFGLDSDENATIFHYENKAIRFATEGTEKIRITSGGNLKLPDNAEIQFGDALNSGNGDLRIFHDSSNSYIQNITGNLIFKNNSADYMICDNSDGSVTLLQNTNTKLQTTTSGITVTGEVAASQDYPNFQPILDFNFIKEKKLDPRIAYSRTGPSSFVNEFGKIVLIGDNIPRFDHDPMTRECRGLLMEEPRTNMITYSAAYDSSSKTNTGSDVYLFSSHEGVISEDFGTAPDGGLTDALLGEGNTGRHTLHIRGSSLSNNTEYSMSIFVKRVSNHSNERYCKLETAIYSTWTHSGSSAVFDLSNGTEVTSPGSNITSGIEHYPDGWFRIHFETTTGTVGGNTGFYLNICSSSGDTSSTTLTSSQGLLLYGTQMEAGNFPTSYIPTNGSITTRGVDITTIDKDEFTEFYNSDEWTMVTHTNVENSQSLVQSPSQVNLINFEGDNNTKKFATRYVTSSTVNQGYVDVIGNMSGTSYYDLTGATVGTYNVKTAHAAKVNDVAVSFNGGTVQTDTSVPMLTNPTRMNIGENPKQLHIKRIMYYPKRLPNSQLVTLTS